MSERSTRSRRDFVLDAAGAATAILLGGRSSWAVPASKAGTLRMVFFTDVHSRVEWDTPLALEQAAHAINARRPELVVAGGDLITDGFQSAAAAVAPRWDVYLAFHRALRARVEAAIGNHDLVAAIPEDGTPPSPEPRAEFCRRLGLEHTYRSLDADGYHLILLDPFAVVGGTLKYEGRIAAEQLAWLEADLGRLPPRTPVVLVSHMPLLTGFYQATEGAAAAGPANRVLVDSLEVLRRLERHNLLLVLQGHLHVDETLRWRQTTFITGGAVCGKWWRGDWQGTPPGFGVLTLRRGRVDWEYVSYGWQPRRP